MKKDLEKSELEEAVESGNRIVVLFYASWCPFSRAFLPIYEKGTVNNPTCMRIMIDDCPDVCDKYGIEIYPTVLVFENGKIVGRLDSEPHKELKEKQLKQLLEK